MSNTREHILKTAFLLFIQKSYKDVTMKEVVEKTGLSKGAVYHYFTSKEDLFRETVVTYFLEGFMVQFEKLDQSSLSNFFHSNKEISEGFYNKLKAEIGDLKNQAGINIYMMMFEAITHLPEIKEKVIEMNNRELEGWKKVVTSARQQGEINSPMSDEQIAATFIFIGDGIGLRGILQGELDGMYAKVIDYWEMFYKELKN